MPTQLTNLLGLSKTKMEAFLHSLGEKPFRAIQLLKWIHQQGETDFGAMTNISKSLRASLQECAEIRPPIIKECYEADDGCYKWIVEVNSGSSVEMVYIPQAGRGTLCISSQAGCSLDCTFCATGKQGFNSDLTTAEIIGQLWLVNQTFNTFGSMGSRRVTNVVMMGMGEPLMNFDNVMDAVGLMMADNCYGLSKRRVTISTSGVVPKIYKMQEYTDASIAVSLHAPNDELRNKIVPINRKYPIKELLTSVNAYLDSLTDNRVVTIEYILISGVNDHRKHARELTKILKTTPCKINLIPFNSFKGSEYNRSTDSAIDNFRKILQDAGYIVTIRTTRGDEIGAACGQLVGQVDDTTSRSARHRVIQGQSNDVQRLKVQ